MKNDIEKWENSDKHKTFIQLLKEKREKLKDELLFLKFKIRTMADKELLSEKELEEVLDSILEIDQETEDVEWIQSILIMDMEKEELFLQFIKTIVTWFVYLSIYQRKENYELCSKIVKVIDIEAKEVENIITAKFGEDPNDLEYIEEILEAYRKQINND